MSPVPVTFVIRSRSGFVRERWIHPDRSVGRFPKSFHRTVISRDVDTYLAIRMPIPKFSPYANDRESLK